MAKARDLQTFYVVEGVRRNQPHVGGWVEVEAPDKETAYLLYHIYYPGGRYGRPATVCTADELRNNAPWDLQGSHHCLAGVIRCEDSRELYERNAYRGLPGREETKEPDAGADADREQRIRAIRRVLALLQARGE